MALRVGGLASGMDIESIVKDLMRAERMPLDKLQQDKQLLEWKQEDYRDINQQVFKLRDAVFDMKLQGTYQTKSASTSDETVLGVSATGSATEGTYTITVNNLASGVSKASKSELADETDVDGNTLSLFDQFSEFTARGFASTEDITVTVNGTELTFDLDQDNIYSVVSKINDADVGVKASYDKDLNRFFLTTSTTGSDTEITITSDESNFLSNEGATYTILKMGIGEGISYKGQDASYDFGDAAGLTSSTNMATINGLNLDLKDSGTTTVTVKSDTDAVFDKIKSFVETYNETLELVTDKTQEKRYRDYKPLTDEQKEDMSDNQIEMWEEKARSGLLKSDSIVRDVISDFRMAMSGIVENISGAYGSLDEIGISSRNRYDNGKLYIDEADLKEALNKDSQGVMDLFINNSDVDDEKGVAVKLYDAVIHSSELITDKAGRESSFSLVDNSYIGKRLSNMSDEINAWENRLTTVEDRYWRQFTRMEEAISRMNSQSAWLSQQFSGA